MELLATILLIAIITSITMYIAIDVIGKAKEKTYITAQNNIVANTNNYLLERGNDFSFIETLDKSIEYQCIKVKNLVDMGYLDTNIEESKVVDNKNVSKDDYIY